MRHRLATRTSNDYGKHPSDLADILEWNSTVDEDMRGWGATVVDAEQPLQDVVAAVLAAARTGSTDL